MSKADFEREWAEFILLVKGGFKGDWTPMNEASYRFYLGDVPVAKLKAALLRIAQGGQVFIPTPAEILEVLGTQRAGRAPQFEEAIERIWQGLSKGRLRGSIDTVSREEAAAADRTALEFMAELHPFVALFAQREGVGRLRLMNRELPVAMGALRKRYNEFVKYEVEVGRDQAALEAAVRRGLPTGKRPSELPSRINAEQFTGAAQIGPGTGQEG